MTQSIIKSGHWSAYPIQGTGVTNIQNKDFYKAKQAIESFGNPDIILSTGPLNEDWDLTHELCSIHDVGNNELGDFWKYYAKIVHNDNF